MKRKFIIGIVLSVLVIPNTPIIGTEIVKAIDGDHFRYANANASFTSIQYIDTSGQLLDLSMILNRKWSIWKFLDCIELTHCVSGAGAII
jgi:hypothetical protein